MKRIGTSENGNPIVEIEADDRAGLLALGQWCTHVRVGSSTNTTPPASAVVAEPKKHAGGRPKKVVAEKPAGRACEICGKPVKSDRAKCCSPACLKEKARRVYREKYSHAARAAAVAADDRLVAPDRAKADAKAARLVALKHAAERLDPVAVTERKATALREEEG